MDFEHVYNSMMGMLCETDERFPSLFEDGMECWNLYEQIYEACIRITQSIDGNDEGENKDVMIIRDSYERMMRIACEAAFGHGRKAGD